jgi:hypothetical protein
MSVAMAPIAKRSAACNDAVQERKGGRHHHAKRRQLVAVMVLYLLTTAPGSRRPCELVVLLGLLELTGFFLVVVRAGLIAFSKLTNNY